MSAAKLERLLNLTALLLETPRPLSAVEIRDRLGVYAAENDAFRRAFERDKDDLRAMGVPLEVQDVPGVVPAVEGYRIPQDRYYLRDPGLTAEEAAAPGVAVAALPGGHVGSLFGAIAARTPVRFTYRGVERRVDPYRLDFLRGRWYLTGFDHTRDDERAFRLDRFESVVARLDGPRFERPSTAVAEERSDGSVVVTMTVTNRDNFRSFVLTFLDHAEVLEPADLRAAVVEWLEAIAA